MIGTPELQREILHSLSLLLFGDTANRRSAFELLKEADDQHVEAFGALAEAHRVAVRASDVLLGCAEELRVNSPAWMKEMLSREQRDTALRFAQVCSELQDNGFSYVVIKSLEHYPDMGSDFDVYVRGEGERIADLLQSRFGAEALPQSVADRISKKRKFRIPGTDKPLEVYAGRLGQAGEHLRLAKLIRKRKVQRTVEGFTFNVPSREDRLAIAVLDRFYRHHDLRLCDVLDTASLLREGTVDFEQLKRDSKRAGIWPGVRTYLSVIDGFYSHYSGQHLPIPPRVLRKADFNADKLVMHNGSLRIPLLPQGARLYARELSKAIRRRDLKKTVRIGILPAVTLASKAATAASEQHKVESDER